MTNNKGKVSVENTKATSNNKSNGNFGKQGWIFIIASGILREIRMELC